MLDISNIYRTITGQQSPAAANGLAEAEMPAPPRAITELAGLLLSACKSCAHEDIKKVIEEVADRSPEDRCLIVNFRDKDGKTPLHHLAGLHFASKFIEQLILNGADCSVRDGSGNLPLFYAVCDQRWDNLQKILSHHVRSADYSAGFEEIRYFALSVMSRAGANCRDQLPDFARLILKDLDLLRENCRSGVTFPPEHAVSRWQGCFARWFSDSWVVGMLSGMREFPQFFRPGEVKELVNTLQPVTGGKILPLHFACRYMGRKDIITSLLDLGADPEALSPGEDLRAFAAPALHFAMKSSDREILSALLDQGIRADARDAGGKDALSSYLEGAPHMTILDARRIEHLLLYYRADNIEPRIEDSVIRHLFSEAQFGALAALHSHGLIPEKYNPVIESHDAGVKFSMNVMDAAAEITDILERLEGDAEWHKAVAFQVRSMLKQKGNFYHALLYARAAEDFMKMPWEIGQGEALGILMPHLLFSYDLKPLAPLARKLEETMDGINLTAEQHFLKGKWHPNESELMLALAHPKAGTWVNRSDFNPITRGLTSITQFIRTGAVVTGVTAANFAKIGVLNHSFRFWKYDAERDRHPEDDRISYPSLLERYGFERAPERNTDYKWRWGGRDVFYGPGYILRPDSKKFSFVRTTHDGKTYYQKFLNPAFVEFRREYLLISTAAYGTLIVRNSSLQFGRDHMKHPAYWSPKAIGDGWTDKDLMNLNPRMLKKDFHHILERGLHDHDGDIQECISSLLVMLAGLKSDYRRWKFDTNIYTAWDDDMPHESRLAGGHFSDGFGALAGFLSRRYYRRELEMRTRGSSGIVVPDLAFINPEYPAWFSYKFTGADGKKTDRLRIDAEVIMALNNLMDGESDDSELQASGLRNFFQEAGFNNQAELILISPEKNR